MASIQCSIVSGNSATTSAYDGTNNKIRLTITSVYYDTVSAKITANWRMEILNSSGTQYNFSGAAGWVNGTEVNYTHGSENGWYWQWNEWSNGKEIASGSVTFSRRTSFSIETKGMFDYVWNSTNWNNGTGCVYSRAVTCNISIPSVGNPSIDISTKDSVSANRNSDNGSIKLSASVSPGSNGGNVTYTLNCNNKTSTNSDLVLNNLRNNTNYNYSGRATNSAGKKASDSGTFFLYPIAPLEPKIGDLSFIRTDNTYTVTALVSSEYDTNRVWDSWISQNLSLSDSSFSSISFSNLEPNRNYNIILMVRDRNSGGPYSYSLISNESYKTFITPGNAPVIKNHGVKKYGQTNVIMNFQADYDINSSLKTWKWDYSTKNDNFESDFSTVVDSNELINLIPNTTYYYRLTVVENIADREAIVLGSFRTDFETQQIQEIKIINIEEELVSLDIIINNPDWVSKISCIIYESDGTTIKYKQDKITNINSVNNFIFENLDPGTDYIAKVQIFTKGQSEDYTSDIKEMAFTTEDGTPIAIINSDGTKKRYKMYAMGKGNIYSPLKLDWINGIYNGNIGDLITDTLSDNLENNDASVLNGISVLPNINYDLENLEENIKYTIFETDINNIIVNKIILNPLEKKTVLMNIDTKKIWISLESETELINKSTAKFYKLNIFRKIQKTLIPKDNIVYIHNKIQYIDIGASGNNIDNTSSIVCLRVIDTNGDNIALGKNVEIIKGKLFSGNLQDIVKEDSVNINNKVILEGESEKNISTIVRIDLGQEYSDIDYIEIWRDYSDNRIYNNSFVYGRDGKTRLTWKFHSYKKEGIYIEKEEGYRFKVYRKFINSIPNIINILKNPLTNTKNGVEILIDANEINLLPFVVDNLISIRTDAILAARQGKILKDEMGDLDLLNTMSKDSIVSAINEIFIEIKGENTYSNVLDAILDFSFKN